MPASRRPRPRSSDKLARGRYLLTIAHCLECHTPEGPSAVHDFAGASGKGGRTFKGPWGESVSANITADPAAGLGQWSDDEIKRAITQGIARDGHKLKPPMAYAAYASMTAAGSRCHRRVSQDATAAAIVPQGGQRCALSAPCPPFRFQLVSKRWARFRLRSSSYGGQVALSRYDFAVVAIEAACAGHDIRFSINGDAS